MIAATHSTWADPFFAENQDIRVNRLSTWEYEFKSITIGSSYSWDFGDGHAAIDGYEVTHSYSTPGTLTVKVSVQTESGPHNGQITLNLPNGAKGAPPEEEEDVPKKAA